jgi:ketosteroid isomerase-like protein
VAAADDDLLEANASFYRAFAARDLPALGVLWSSSASVACVHPGWAPLYGRARVLRSFRDIFANPRAPKVSFSSPTAHLMGDTAFVVCLEEVGGARLVATNVFTREDGSWRMVHHQAGPCSTDADSNDDADPSALN